jgi:hypothetical protein
MADISCINSSFVICVKSVFIIVSMIQLLAHH